MKKNILTAILLILSMSAMAQKETDNTTHTIMELHNAYRFYAQAHINGNWSTSEDVRYLKFKDVLNWGADFEFGYNFTDFWGVYGEFNWQKNKAATFDNNGNRAAYHFTSYEPSINMTYNLTNGLLHYMPGRRNNLYIHLGPALAIRPEIKAENRPAGNYWNYENNGEDLKSKVIVGGQLGLNYVYSLNDWFAFTADITGTVYGDKFSGRADNGVAVDGRINLGVGIRVYLNKVPEPVPEIITRDVHITKYDTIRISQYKPAIDVNLYKVSFDADKSSIESKQEGIVKQIAEKLNENPSRVVYVIGYADKNSDSKNNITALKKNRADAVTNELIIKYHIDPDRIIKHDNAKTAPFTSAASNNRSTICIVTDLKHN